MKGIVRGWLYGHRVEWDGDDQVWFYVDTKEKTEEVPYRPCPVCHITPTDEGHDPCIANLPEVKFACCGHGVERGYIAFEDGRVIRFEDMERDDDTDSRFPPITSPAF